MARTRWGYQVPVVSATDQDGTTILRLDFGNSCFGSFTIPRKLASVPRKITLFLEIDDAGSVQTIESKTCEAALDGGLGNG